MAYKIFSRLFVVMLLAAPAAKASLLTYDFSWSGDGGSTMVGSFSFDESVALDGFVRDNELTSLMFEGFVNSVSVGSTSILFPDATLNFNFDATLEELILGGNSFNDDGQRWNVDGPGLGWEAGSSSASFYFDGVFDVASQTSNPNFVPVTRRQDVPAPATLALLAIGLIGLGRRLQR